MSWRADQLEQVWCDGCGGHLASGVVTRPDGMRVVECITCGLAYLNPRPNRKYIRELYRDEYFRMTAENRIGYHNYSDDTLRPSHEAAAANKLDITSAHAVIGGKRVLEVGCATGEFCHALRRRGAMAVGIDLSGEVISLAKAQYSDIDFRVADMESLAADEVFDLIFAWEVIEHVPGPREFLQHARRHLVPGGYFILSTPNYACAKRVQPELWAGFLHSFEHLYFFDRRSLEALAGREGFRTLISYSGGGNGLVGRPPRMRSVARYVLSKLGLLTFVRSLRASIYPRGVGYSTERQADHNLLMILQQSLDVDPRN